MSARLGLSVLAIAFCCAMQSRAQAPLESKNISGDLGADRLNALSDARRAAQKELDEKRAAFDTPGIANALEAGFYLIAIARITAVQLPNDTTPRTRVTFQVEQFLRGESDVKRFDVESRWAPKSPTSDEGPQIIVASNYRETALDKSRPKEGDRYLLGYTQEYGNVDPVFVSGVVDLQDPSQAELTGNVTRFLAMENEANLNGFETYLDGLDDKAPWIRDIAIHKLTKSDSCNASPKCAERFLAVVKRGLESDTPNERQEALFWLVWVDSVSRSEKARGVSPGGLPVLPDSALRVLFDAATKDQNLVVGDEAFQYEQMFELHRTGSPGDCFVIVPELRKSARMRSQTQPPLPPEFQLSYTYGCLPRQ